MTCQPAAPIVEGLGLRIDITEGSLVANAILIAKVIDENGHVGISISNSPGTSWLDELGLVTAAAEMIKPALTYVADED